GDQLEITGRAALVGHDQEAVAALLAPVMLDVVLVPRLTRRNHTRYHVRALGGHEPDFGRRLRRGLDEYEPSASRTLHAEIEAFVFLPEHLYVVTRRCSQRVPPYFVRSHRVVRRAVERGARRIATCEPGGAVRGGGVGGGVGG